MSNKAKLPHWDYLDKTIHTQFDFTQLDRLPTDTPSTKLNQLNARINTRNEELELMFIEIECDRIDREDDEKNNPKKRTKTRMTRADLFEDIDDATKAELQSEGFELE